MADKSGFELRGGDVQLTPIVSPQCFRINLQRAADFALRNALGGKHLDEAPVGYAGDVRRSSTGGSRVHLIHRREKTRPLCFGGEKKIRP
ncbi:hypothetical protein HJC04_14005 [Rhizobium sp. NLR8a]|uniref:hypothetical protein n=1 Tax=Rhizobium sp. NLR8a TaxID=2731119 RepID=UPI001C836BD4|nr:hypothetical protein [Rhizobium sp. NLR8a]MBX5221422.1 hypothetical protein [Rhizobium sp. NLR8a]